MISLISALLMGAPLIAAAPRGIAPRPALIMNSCGMVDSPVIFKDQPTTRDGEIAGTRYLQFFSAPGHEDDAIPKYSNNVADSSVFVGTSKVPDGVTLRDGYCLIRMLRGDLSTEQSPYLMWAGPEHYKNMDGYAAEVVAGTTAKYLQCRAADNDGNPSNELHCLIDGGNLPVPLGICPRKVWDGRQEVHDWVTYPALSLSGNNAAQNCTKTHLYMGNYLGSGDASSIMSWEP